MKIAISPSKHKQSRALECAHVSITCCSFRRSKLAELENGVLINEDQLILDATGKPVLKLYSYNAQTYLGYVRLPV